MAPLPSSHAQQALLNLERSQVPPVELLDEAARIIGVSVGEIQRSISDHEGTLSAQSHASQFAPKEEWVLRWLLKKIKNSKTVSRADCSMETASQ